MIKIPLFKYKGINGELITPIDLGIDHEPMVRLVADLGFYLTDGETNTGAIDVTEDEVILWSEKEYEDFDPDIEEYTIEKGET